MYGCAGALRRRVRPDRARGRSHCSTCSCSQYKTPITSEGEGAFSFSSPSDSWAEGLGGNVTTLIGAPGPVSTYLFTAGYDLGPPASGTTEPEPTPETGEGSPTWGPVTTDRPTEQPEPEPEPDPSGPTTERRCRDKGCGGQGGAALLGSRRALMSGRRARVVVSCSGSDPCRGKVGFVQARARRFDLGAGARGRLRIVVPRELRRRVLRTGRARGRVAVASRLGDERVEVRQRVRIRTRP